MKNFSFTLWSGPQTPEAVDVFPSFIEFFLPPRFRMSACRQSPSKRGISGSGMHWMTHANALITLASGYRKPLALAVQGVCFCTAVNSGSNNPEIFHYEN